MEIKKINESLTRSYNENGEIEERKNSEQYRLISEDGQPIGDINLYQSSANISIGFGGFSTIEEGFEKIKVLFNVKD